MNLSSHASRSPGRAPAPAREDDERASLARILDAVRARKGLDFRGYRAGTLLRRIRSRMISAGAASMPEYLDRLRTDPREADALVERLTIKVSRFFRAPSCFEPLRAALESRRAERGGPPLQVWSAGCANGEEPYSLAILLTELGQRSAAPDVLATDVDAAALQRAARGHYAPEVLANLPRVLAARYFELELGLTEPYRVRPELRARVAFRFHDLAGSTWAPEGKRFDLVSCRNVLIYLDAPLRRKVEGLLAASLLPGGVLWLGEAEWPSPELASQLEVLDRRARVFRLRAGGEARG